jgi:hypothetical protein
MNDVASMKSKLSKKQNQVLQASREAMNIHTKIRLAEEAVDQYENEPNSDDDYDALVKALDEAKKIGANSQANIDSLNRSITRLQSRIRKCEHASNILNIDADALAVAQEYMVISDNGAADEKTINEVIDLAIDDFRHKSTEMRDGTAFTIQVNNIMKKNDWKSMQKDLSFIIALTSTGVSEFDTNDETVRLSCIYILKHSRDKAARRILLDDLHYE